MKVDLSFLLAPQTESSVPTVPTGDADLFVQALVMAQANPAGIIPDPSPPDPGPSPNFIGVGEAVPFQPNAEEQEPDLQPQTESNPQGFQAGDYLLAANFAPIAGATIVGTTPAESGVATQAPPVVTSSVSSSAAVKSTLALTFINATNEWTGDRVTPAISNSHPNFQTTGEDSEQLIGVEVPAPAPAPKATPWLVDNGTAQDSTVGSRLEIPGTQVFDQQIVKKLNPVAITVRQAATVESPIATVTLQDLVSGMRKVDPGTFKASNDGPFFSASGTVPAASAVSSSALPTDGSPKDAPFAVQPNVNSQKPLATDPNSPLNGIASGAMSSAPTKMKEGSDALFEVSGESNSPAEVPTLQPPVTQAPIKVTEATLPLGREVANDVVRQLIERIEEMEVFRPQNQMVLKLNPEHLGAITIMVKTSKGETEAEITSSNEQVHQALDAARPALQRTLEVKGVNLTSLSLHFSAEGGSSTPQGQPQDAQRTQQLFNHVPVPRVDSGHESESISYRTESNSLNLVI